MSQLYNHVKLRCPSPEIGMGATIFHYTDRSAATIVQISKSGKTIYIRCDIAIRVDDNGMSECQDYEYKYNEKAPLIKVTLRKDGQWRISKDGRKVGIGKRDQYHDYSV